MKFFLKKSTWFRIVLLISMCFIICVIGYERYCVDLFKNTELEISQTKLEEDWGKPNQILKEGDGSKVVFYYTFLGEYVFGIDKFQNVELKYME